MALLTFALLVSAFTAHAGHGDAFFSDPKPLELVIQTDFSSLHSRAPDPDPVVPGSFSWADQKLAVELQVRGGVRKGICGLLPPLKVVLPKGDRPAPFRKMDRDLKMVTACKPNPGPGERDALYREYVQYRLLNAADFPSFRVKLANVVYRDPDGGEHGKGPAFFIENVKDAAKRLGFGPKSAARPAAELGAELTTAELLLRNFDYVVPSPADKQPHNVRSVRNEQNEIVAMVPYDFDLSLLTRELKPGQPEDTGRYIEMYFLTPQKLRLALPYFQKIIDHREAMLAEISASPLSESDKLAFAENVKEFCDAAAAVIKEAAKNPEK